MAGYLLVQSRSVRVGSRARPLFDAGVHPVAIELDFVQPFRAVRRLAHEPD
jgi:hypothetical protein